MLWQVYIFPSPGRPDIDGRRIAGELEELGITRAPRVQSARGYLLEGKLSRADVERIARDLLADPVIESFATSDSSGELRSSAGADNPQSAIRNPQFEIASVLLKPGVMDPVAQSVQAAIRQLGFGVDEVHTFRRYWIAGMDGNAQREQVAKRVLANDAIEQVVWGPLELDQLPHGQSYRFELIRVPLRTMTDSELERVSRDQQLSLSLTEMHTIQRHFRDIARDPTDAELETIAQTWSEHCSHKTLRGRIDYEELDAQGTVTRSEHFENLLKETIFKATQDIRKSLGPDRDWCVSVFEDNAGVVRFDDRYNVCFKVETHNHPSAIEPYGGANTGLGGVLRDSMGTGLGAKPIANTDVFCFAPPDLAADQVPPGVLHPKRVMKGVVAGVRDYGNRMGIPTVNGAIYFDPRYLGNPLVFCGSVGLIPRDRSKKQTKPGDLIVAVGGRTGRDGIHGATFSSVELTHESEQLSGGAVQIGNAITEKMMLDVILEARDRGLYHAITDCGAGGFSSAVGEMGADIGAEVALDQVPLKYRGLSYTEIWISEAQERMVLAVPESNWAAFQQLCNAEGVEATVIGRFEPTGRLTLKYDNHVVADLDMHFLHEGRPPVVRKAVWKQTTDRPDALTAANRHASAATRDSTEPPFNESLRRILSSLNVCSKEWVIRQYDHEVQGGSVIKPLVGAANDGPSDAAVIRPVLGSHRGLAIACGMNPHYGDLDPYWMAASAIDEAIRNCVAVGADPDRIAILDNFCWGNTDRPEELGKLVRAALACRDIATAYGTPFISGKDSLNNEFKVQIGQVSNLKSRMSDGDRIVIPPTLLISALGQIDDVRRCVTMDLKAPGNWLFLVGRTSNELGGSHLKLIAGYDDGGFVPRVDPTMGRFVMRFVHEAIGKQLVCSCHDLSEGGLAVGLAEMAFAGELGVTASIYEPHCAALGERETNWVPENDEAAGMLFSESNSRFVLEVPADRFKEFLSLVSHWSKDRDRGSAGRFGFSCTYLGTVVEDPTLLIIRGPAPWIKWQERPPVSETEESPLIYAAISELKDCWQRPLRW